MLWFCLRWCWLSFVIGLKPLLSWLIRTMILGFQLIKSKTRSVATRCTRASRALYPWHIFPLLVRVKHFPALCTVCIFSYEVYFLDFFFVTIFIPATVKYNISYWVQFFLTKLKNSGRFSEIANKRALVGVKIHYWPKNFTWTKQISQFLPEHLCWMFDQMILACEKPNTPSLPPRWVRSSIFPESVIISEPRNTCNLKVWKHIATKKLFDGKF